MEPLIVEGADILVVGEMPSAFDDKKGSYQPDRALKQFAEWLGRPFHYTTIVRCAGGTPKGEEMKACKGYLELLIEELKPSRILLLGAMAVKGFTRKKISEVHGQVLDYQGIPVHPLYSPGMAFRDPSKIEPLRRAVERIFNPVEEKPFEFTTIRKLKEWNEFIDDFSEADVFAFDTETTGLDMFDPEGKINTLQISTYEHNWILPLAIRDTPWDRKEQEEFIHTIIELSEGKKAIGHNGKFDNKWLMSDYGVKFHLWFDTQLASHVLDENRQHGLKPLSVDLLGADGYDIPLKDKLGLGDLKKFYKYAAKDSFYTLQLFDIFYKELRQDRILRRLFFKLVMPVARMFEETEMDGLAVDEARLRKTRKRLLCEKALIEDDLNELAGGDDINWESPAQVGKLLFEKLKITPPERTPTGAPSTAESALNQIDHPITNLLKDYRGVCKNLSTYVDGWKALMHGDRLYLPVKIIGTVTGRFSSRLHQVPRDPRIRGHIIAPEGWEFVCADYSQIELRLVAHESQDPRMLLAYHTGEDLHLLTAVNATGLDPETITKEQRKMAKAINFGFVYGMQWKKFAAYSRDNYEITITDEESKRFRRTFFQLFASLPAWHERQKKLVHSMGYVSNLAGRRRRLPGINSNDRGVVAEAERQAINSPIQGFGSGDLKAMAMVEIHETLPRDEVRIQGEVHDSVLMWIKKGTLERNIPKIKKIMEHPKRMDEFKIELSVPLAVDVEVGRWGEGVKWEK